MSRRIAVFLLFISSFAYGFRDLDLRLDPHYYATERGTDPTGQLVALVRQNWSSTAPDDWNLTFHLEAEAQGRRDVSFDIDRAWFRVGALVVGRTHPFDLIQLPAATDPWGLLAQRQSQDRGLLLGYGFDPLLPEPRPILLGWVGLHLVLGQESPVTAVFSATPFFLPDMGPELMLSPQVSAARFAHRPPGYVEIDGQTYPLQLVLDKSRIWNDVVLRPQLMAATRIRWNQSLETWLVASRAPSPEGDVRSDAYLKVSGTGVTAVAQVQPYFDERWDFSVTQVWHISRHYWEPRLEASLVRSSDQSAGGQLAVSCRYLRASVLEEKRWAASQFSISAGRYTDLLLQIEGRLPISPVLLFAGAKTHPQQGDLWLRGGARWRVDKGMSVDMGGDWFQGSETSYFGEWRSNSRVYVAFQWELGA